MSLLTNLRYAARSLRKKPAFAGTLRDGLGVMNDATNLQDQNRSMDSWEKTSILFAVAALLPTLALAAATTW